MIRRAFGWLGVAAGAAFGATLAVWAQEPYPLSIIERNVLTPELRPGEKLRVEILADRRKRCEQEVTRFVQGPMGTASGFPGLGNTIMAAWGAMPT
jgi:hypothetical protein